MATVSISHASSQLARRCRSAVWLPKRCTGSSARSSGTATQCSSPPMSIPAAFKLMRSSSCRSRLACFLLLCFALRAMPILLHNPCADGQSRARMLRSSILSNGITPGVSPWRCSWHPMGQAPKRGSEPPLGYRPQLSTARPQLYPTWQALARCLFLTFDRLGRAQLGSS